jgi:hypothetical protein
MALPFTPLVLPAGAHSNGQSATAQPFRALNNGDTVAPAVRPVTLPTPHTATPTHPAAPPSVTALREDGQVKQIRVQCSCGEVIELECVY